jgi:hypothetical protein
MLKNTHNNRGEELPVPCLPLTRVVVILFAINTMALYISSIVSPVSIFSAIKSSTG